MARIEGKPIGQVLEVRIFFSLGMTVTGNSPQDDATYDDDADDELPRTASSLPSIGALGLLAIFGALAVAFVRKF